MGYFEPLQRVDSLPLLVQAPSLLRDAEIRALHMELLRQASQISYYYLSDADPALFQYFRPYYEGIAALLRPRFDPATLTTLSRHRFFISHGLEPHPGNPDQQIVSLSGLERLMGYTSELAPTGPQEITLTSGNPDMDLVASLELIFGDRLPWLICHYTRRDLIDLLKQGQQLRRGEEAIAELEAERDRALFEKNQEAINANIKKHGGFFPG